MNKAERIVITGIGPLTAGGSGIDEVWDAIINRRTGLVEEEYSIDDEGIKKFYVHAIKDFDINKYNIDRQILNEVESWKEGDNIIDIYYFLATIKMAIDDSGIIIDENNKNKIGLMISHENLGLDHFYWKVINELSYTDTVDIEKPKTKKDFLYDFYKKFHRTGYELQTFMGLFHIAKIFNIHGFSLFINNACASGLYAIEAASDAIRSGKCERMIVAAVDHASIFKHMWFSDINTYAKDGKIKPFAANRDGFTIGDGGAALVLETIESAQKRKANIYAEYIGSDFVLEGWKVTYPDVSNNLYESMVRDALNRSGIKPADVGLVVPHGVGTNITDKYEAKAVNRVFGDKTKITALKPYIGHTLGSTALLETAIMLMALKNDLIPPTLNCEKFDRDLGINLVRKIEDANEIRIAMKTACGFAGFNAACVFRINP